MSLDKHGTPLLPEAFSKQRTRYFGGSINKMKTQFYYVGGIDGLIKLNEGNGFIIPYNLIITEFRAICGYGCDNMGVFLTVNDQLVGIEPKRMTYSVKTIPSLTTFSIFHMMELFQYADLSWELNIPLKKLDRITAIPYSRENSSELCTMTLQFKYIKEESLLEATEGW